MNIFNIYLDKINDLIIKLNKEKIITLPDDLNSINVDVPPKKLDCDISTNVAMVLSKPNKKTPMDIALIIVKYLKTDKNIDNVSIAKPGFINIKFKLIFWNIFLKEIIKNNKNYGINDKERKKKYLIEFVSANPTGPLHVGHSRGAILGDVISNILKFNKHDVIKEYYVNDHGNQIFIFTKSIYLRIREILKNEKFPIQDKNLYPGDYLIKIAENIISKNKELNFENFELISKKLVEISVSESLKLIKSNLKKLGVNHDNFVSETKIIKTEGVKKVIDKLNKLNLIYEGKIDAPTNSNKQDNWIERNQLLFKSTNFGDDKDRALQKSDDSWTYFASDVAYHNNKLERRFDILINILGADHAGYVKRITSVVEALSGKKNKLICKVSQLVKLIKDGKPFKMSKRKGDYITVEDLINEVGKDATRFIMLNRSSDVELDFDFTKVKEKSKDNPLYYVQYCYARISSLLRHVDEEIDNDIFIDKFDFIYTHDEIKIFKKISQWPKCLDVSSNKLEPHRIPVYLYELASEFHSYWNLGKENENKRFINKNNKISNDKMVFLKVISNVIKSGLDIMGVDSPKEM